MTINEFSAKYGVDRQTVYKSTYIATMHSPTGQRNYNYDEDRLKAAVKSVLTERIQFHREREEKAEKQLKRLCVTEI